MSRCKSDRIALWACIYFVLAVPFAAVLPSWVGWENGPIEILQDLVLFVGAIYCITLFCRASGRYRHGLWLAASAYFLILLGRELSWGRIFMPIGMTDHGPDFVSMHALPYYKVVYGIIAVAILMTLYKSPADVTLYILNTFDWRSSRSISESLFHCFLYRS